MIPFIKPDKPNTELFNTLLSTSIEQNHYTNFGPNHNKLKETLVELTGISNVILTCNATVALEGLHTLLSRKCGIAYLPSFTFPATNQGCLVSTITGSTINQGQNIGRTSWKCSSYVFSYAITVNPFGSTNPVCERSKEPTYWVIDNAAGLLPQAKEWLAAGADAVVYSLHATKILSACEGGVIFFRTNEIYEDYLEHMNFGFKPLADGSRLVSYQGSNHKMSELSAAWCLSMLPGLNKNIEKRQKIADAYKAFCVEYNVPYIPSLQAFWLLGKEDALKIRKFGLINGIDFRPYYQKLPFDNSNCPNTKLFTTNGFCLPTRSTLTDSELGLILDCLQAAKLLCLI